MPNIAKSASPAGPVRFQNPAMSEPRVAGRGPSGASSNGRDASGPRNANATPAHDDDHASPPVRTPLPVVGDYTEPDEIVIVLGYRSSPRGRLRLMQRWRTRIVVRSTVPAARFVFTGAPTRGGAPEASLVADHAVDALGVPRENVVLEECARTTWENIAYSIPHIEQAPSIRIASNTFHARRARKYLAKLSPLLAARLHRARDHVPGELVLALYEWRRSRRERRG